MKRTNSEIYHTELLLTLDYLLNYTDEDHPATQQDICRHAKNFGLKYEGGKPGDDVRRQRVGECLQFLQSICYKFEKTDKVPFVINSTPSGKFYIEEKNRLNEEQIIKVLAAIKNDKYTRDEDTDFLVERLLDSLSNKHNRAFFKNELEKASKGVKKYSFATNRKLRLVNKAYNEGKMLKIRYEIYDKNNIDIHVYDFWYRVYKIKEYRNKPYAILIPIYTGDLIFYKGFIFDTIENLNIPKGPDKEVLCDDFDEKRDLDKLFREKSRWVRKYYDSPETMIEENKMPISGIAFRTSFYVKRVFLKFVKPSFEDFFSTSFDAVGCVSFDIVDGKGIDPKKNKEDYIIPHPLKDGEQPEFFVVNTYIDPDAFMSWLVSDVHGDGNTSVSDMVVVVGPETFNRRLYDFYIGHAKKYINRLNPEDVERINKSTDRFLK